GGVLTINGAPVGRELGKYYLKEQISTASGIERGARSGLKAGPRLATTRVADQIGDAADGSIIMVVATDAPLDARNLKRLASRAMLGLARTGSPSTNGSGDYVIAFSAANLIRAGDNLRSPQTLVNDVPPVRGGRARDRGSDIQFALQGHDRHRPRRPSSRGVADRKDGGDFEKIRRGEIENRRRHGTTPQPETIRRRRSPASSTVGRG